MRKIIVNVEDNGMPVPTLHPYMEAKLAASRCRVALNEEGEDITVKTVSTDAVGVYEQYGKECLGLDVKYFLNGKESTCEEIFESFNRSFVFLDGICKNAKG